MTRQKWEGRYAMVKTEVELRVELEPEPQGAELSDLLEVTEHDCFVGSSLTVEPDYRWTVNGRTIG